MRFIDNIIPRMKFSCWNSPLSKFDNQEKKLPFKKVRFACHILHNTRVLINSLHKYANGKQSTKSDDVR